MEKHIGVTPKIHQTNVFEAKRIRLSFFVYFGKATLAQAFLML
ncbi:hypothetical protein HSISS2_990 [Streptococcus sp. HSISS2]|nr:hypothetical protein HSISS2_990 [Streptococcus sp. HSISS2]